MSLKFFSFIVFLLISIQYSFSLPPINSTHPRLQKLTWSRIYSQLCDKKIIHCNNSKHKIAKIEGLDFQSSSIVLTVNSAKNRVFTKYILNEIEHLESQFNKSCFYEKFTENNVVEKCPQKSEVKNWQFVTCPKKINHASEVYYFGKNDKCYNFKADMIAFTENPQVDLIYSINKEIIEFLFKNFNIFPAGLKWNNENDQIEVFYY